MSSSAWCTVESDPGIFTELITEIGVKGIQVEDVIDLELVDKEHLKPIYGVLFLFKWAGGGDSRPVDMHAPVFFARQVITNACATQALLSILLNLSDHVDLGPELKNLKEFSSHLDYDMRGEAIGNSEVIRKAHNSYARPEPFVFEEKPSSGSGDDELFHYIGYVPVNGQLWELDGLRAGPIACGSLNGKNPFTDARDQNEWLTLARQVIQQRIERYGGSDGKFNMMVFVKNRTDAINAEIAALKASSSSSSDMAVDSAATSSTSSSSSSNSSSNSTSTSTIAFPLTSVLLPVADRLTELQSMLKEEEAKAKGWKVENVRRKHNYVPFIFNLLKTLAERGKLAGLVEHATKVKAQRVARTATKPTKTTTSSASSTATTNASASTTTSSTTTAATSATTAPTTPPQ